MLSHSKFSIWIVDEDADSIFFYREFLGSYYPLRILRSLKDLSVALSEVAQAACAHPILVVSEVHLRDGSILETNSSVLESLPLLVVSSDSKEKTIASCFDRGAIDFFAKPIRKAEFSVKVGRLLSKRRKEVTGAGGSVPEITFCPRTFSLRRGNFSAAKLTAKELQIFHVLKAATQKITRRSIKQQVWKNVSVTPKTFDVHLFNLRKKSSQLAVKLFFPRQISMS